MHLLTRLPHLRFTAIKRYWPRLCPTDARVLLRAILLSEDASRKVPLAARLKLVDSAVATMDVQEVGIQLLFMNHDRMTN